MVKLDIPKLKMLVFENDWCAQCYTERPIIHRLAIKYHDQLEVEVLNAIRKDQLFTDLPLNIMIN